MKHFERVTGISVGRPADSESSECAFSVLSNAMARPENGEIRLAGSQQPKIKAGLAFMLASKLHGEPESIEQALAVVEFVIPALEVTDNGRGILYATGGRPVRPDKLDLRTLGVVLEQNGHIVGMGAGAQVLDHPAQAIIAAARHMAAKGESLAEGSLVLTTGITPEVDVAAQDNILARYQDMGSISLRFV